MILWPSSVDFWGLECFMLEFDSRYFCLYFVIEFPITIFTWKILYSFQSDDSKRICPVNKNHLISNKTFQDHLEICKLKSNGYEKNETFLSEPINDDCSIKLSSAKKLEVLGAAKGNKSEFRTGNKVAMLWIMCKFNWFYHLLPR